MSAKYSAEAPIPEELAKQLRSAANAMDSASFRSWKFWIGFLWGMIVLGALDYGDVHVCVGACDPLGRAVIEAVEAMP